MKLGIATNQMVSFKKWFWPFKYKDHPCCPRNRDDLWSER